MASNERVLIAIDLPADKYLVDEWITVLQAELWARRTAKSKVIKCTDDDGDGSVVGSMTIQWVKR